MFLSQIFDKKGLGIWNYTQRRGMCFVPLNFDRMCSGQEFTEPVARGLVVGYFDQGDGHGSLDSYPRGVRTAKNALDGSVLGIRCISGRPRYAKCAELEFDPLASRWVG